MTHTKNNLSQCHSVQHHSHIYRPGIELMPTQWQATVCPGIVFEKKNIYNSQPVISEKQLTDTSGSLATGRSYQYLTFSCVVTPQVLKKNYTKSMLENVAKSEFKKKPTWRWITIFIAPRCCKSKTNIILKNSSQNLSFTLNDISHRWYKTRCAVLDKCLQKQEPANISASASHYARTLCSHHAFLVIFEGL